MSEGLAKPCTAFEGVRLLVSGPLAEVVLAVKDAVDRGAREPLLVFDDATGKALDFDLRGSKDEVIARLSCPGPYGERTPSSIGASSQANGEKPVETRGRGRPKLGVIAREVTLLPRHWDWLAAQPGGASAVLRRLVEEARRTGAASEKRRTAQEAAYCFMSATAGDLPGFEEAARALFAEDRFRAEQHMTDWPEDIRRHALRLAWGAA